MILWLRFRPDRFKSCTRALPKPGRFAAAASTRSTAPRAYSFLVIVVVPRRNTVWMVRNVILRIPGLRSLLPRVSRPLLPLTRFTAATEPRITLTRPGGRSSARLLHQSPTRYSSSSPPSRGSSPEPESYELPPGASMSQRLKHLIKSYGWYALGVYLLLGVADFTVAFAAVHIFGAEHVGHVAASVKEVFARLLPSRPAEPGRDEMDSASHSHGGGSEGIWAMVVLAYTIHKTVFLPVRVGLTAAVTPRLVGWLRSRGWAGSAGTKRAAQEMRERIRNRTGRDQA